MLNVPEPKYQANIRWKWEKKKMICIANPSVSNKLILKIKIIKMTGDGSGYHSIVNSTFVPGGIKKIIGTD